MTVVETFCACGCGQTFERVDRWGRSRRFIHGHNSGDSNVRLADEKNPSWKGEQASYTALHMWVSRHKTKTGICAACWADAGTAWRGGTQWHSKGHKYLRELDEWIELCPSCNHWRRAVVA